MIIRIIRPALFFVHFLSQRLIVINFPADLFLDGHNTTPRKIFLPKP